jgi:TolB protein
MRLAPLALALALAAPASALEPAPWSPGASDFLFSSNRDGNPEIFVLRAGQTEWTNLSNHGDRDNWPVWSPRGDWIVFQSHRGGSLDIWTMMADGSSQARLTYDPEPDYLPSWSPDGKRIVFTSWRKEAGDSVRAPHLYIMNADGTRARRLVYRSLETSSGATWSPSGRRIVYSRRAGEKGADLWVADRDGRNETRITRGGDTYHGSPVFSPDGRQIAYYADDGKTSAIEVVNADGTGRRVVLAEGKNWYPRWSPDGKWLTYSAAISADDPNNIDVFVISATGEGPPVPLASSPARESEGSWRPAR